MAIIPGQGCSRVLSNRRWEDYRSMKQALSNSIIKEVIIAGSCTTDGAATEISFCDNILNYIAAEGQVYVRCEANDANQHDKYVYIEYQDDTGAIKAILTADLDGADSTAEVIVTGASDFYRLRRMISEVESASGGTKSIMLTDSAWDGVADTFGELKDGNTCFALERFFTQPSSVCDSYLAFFQVYGNKTGTSAADDTFFIDITLTPKALSTSDGFAEPQTAADITLHFDFEYGLQCSPVILLEPATEVIFKIGDNAAAGKVFLMAVMVEDYSQGGK